MRDSLIRERCGGELSVMKTREWKVMKLFGHVERIGEDRMLEIVFRVFVFVCACVYVCKRYKGEREA